MKSIGTAAIAVTMLLALAGCSAASNEAKSAPSVTSINTPAAPSPTPTETAEAGTRANPLPIGQTRKLAADSAWSVGATGPSVVGTDTLTLPAAITIDWDAVRAQVPTIDNDGADVAGSVHFAFVTTAGKTYDQADYNSTAPNNYLDLGLAFPPAQPRVNVAMTVPSGEVEGGAWKVTNNRGDSVWIAAK